LNVYLLLIGQAAASEPVTLAEQAGRSFTYGKERFRLPVPTLREIRELTDWWWNARQEDPHSREAKHAEVYKTYAPEHYQQQLAQSVQHWQHHAVTVQRDYEALLAQRNIATMSVPEAWTLYKAAQAERQAYIRD